MNDGRWSAIRDALETWPKTTRLCVIITSDSGANAGTSLAGLEALSVPAGSLSCRSSAQLRVAGMALLRSVVSPVAACTFLAPPR